MTGFDEWLTRLAGAISLGLVLLAFLWTVLRRRRQSTASIPSGGAERILPGDGPFTPGQVERFAMARSSDGDVIALCTDWLRLREQHRRDVAILNAELTDAVSRLPAPDRRRPSLAGGPTNEEGGDE